MTNFAHLVPAVLLLGGALYAFVLLTSKQHDAVHPRPDVQALSDHSLRDQKILQIASNPMPVSFYFNDLARPETKYQERPHVSAMHVNAGASRLQTYAQAPVVVPSIFAPAAHAHYGMAPISVSVIQHPRFRVGEGFHSHAVSQLPMTKTTGRVFGDRDDQGYFTSYVAYLVFKFTKLADSSICTGTVIGKNHVLTAGHCVKESVVKGELDFKSSYLVMGSAVGKEGDVARKILAVYIHDTFARIFDPETNSQLIATRGDLALVVVADLPEDKYEPFELPPAGAKRSDVDTVGIAGYGGYAVLNDKKDKVVGTQFGVLHYAWVFVFENKFCFTENKDLPLIQKDKEAVFFCAIGGKQEESPIITSGCKGDSGGPMFITNGDEKYVVYGISSKGIFATTKEEDNYGCGRDDTKAVYTDLIPFRQDLFNALQTTDTDKLAAANWGLVGKYPDEKK